MDSMTIRSIIFVGFPEMLFIVLTTLTTAGYKDALNFKDMKNIYKILLSSALITIVSVTFRSFVPLLIYNVILATFIYPLIIYAIFRYKLFPIIMGVLLSLVILVIGESIAVSSILKILGISLEITYSNDFLRILVSLPVRVFQLLGIIILSRVRNINFYALKLSTEDLIQTILFGLLIISSMISVETGLKNIERDFKTITTLIVNICIIVIFTTWMVYKWFKLKNRSLISRKIHDFELERIKSLLKEGYTDHVIELIDETLRERGK
ncbi:MAG: hypothetical protein HPY74_13280 [Firmicutes bacterium]|nr:hypothetical protein [Bacillota bacterium]